MFEKLKTINCFNSATVMLISLLVFFITAFCAFNINAVAVFDINAVKFFHTFAVGDTVQTAIAITDFGDKYNMIYPGVFLLGLFVYFNRFREAVLFALASETSYIITKIMKNIFQRPRPPAEFNLIEPYSSSFPSGHSLVSMCFYGIMIYFCYKYIKNIWLKNILIAVLSLIILLIGFSRVYLGVHYPSDVIAGFSLGIFWISMWVVLYKLYLNKITNTELEKNI